MPIIYQLIDRENISLMVVQSTREKNGYYDGISSNPDLVILDEDFEYRKNIDEFNLEIVYGCVE